MWVRGIIGAVLIIAGIVWILQGANVMHGSGMSGHGAYAVLGAIVLIIGATLVRWAWRVRTRHTH
jgi:hypothetical protein